MVAPQTPTPPVLYLASQSPRRRQLLAQIGAAHELLLPGDALGVQQLQSLEVQLQGEGGAA